MGKIFYMIGKSACGKDTIYRMLLEKRPSLKTYIMYTTRPMRDGERDGETYHFTDEGTIRAFRSDGLLIESRTYETVKGPWTYATVDDGQIDLSAGDYLIPGGTLESYLSLRDHFGADNIVPVYIEVDDGERLKRAIEREEQQEIPKYKEMCRRFLADSEDFSEDKLESAGIRRRFVNENSAECAEEILREMDREAV